MNCNVSVPCGKCPECVKRRTSGWSFRLMQEEKDSYYARFITLTYDTQFVPITRAHYMTLNKKHCQDFFKLLRYNVKEYRKGRPFSAGYLYPIKYYLVGEYGDQKKRPHYHILMFNIPPDEFHLIEKSWPYGQVNFGDERGVTGASIGYCLTYISQPGSIPEHKNDDRIPQFSLMSKGLGKSYLTPEMVAWHKADLLERMHCVAEGNKKIAMPRYYKDIIYPKNSLGTSPERQLIAQHQIPKMDDRVAEELKKNPNYYRDRAELHKQQFAQQKKSKNRTL